MSILGQLPALSTDLVAPALIVVGVAAIGVIVLVSARERRGRRAAQVTRPRPVPIRPTATHGPRDGTAAERTATDLLDLSRRLAAQLDTKAERLERLLDDARSVIEILETREAQRDDVPPPEQRPSPTTPPPALDPFTRNVYELADEGHPVIEIARRLDDQIGKVELVLALREASTAHSG